MFGNFFSVQRPCGFVQGMVGEVLPATWRLVEYIPTKNRETMKVLRPKNMGSYNPLRLWVSMVHIYSIYYSGYEIII